MNSKQGYILHVFAVFLCLISAKTHDLLQFIFYLDHQSQKRSIFVHSNIASGDEAFDQLDPLVDVIDSKQALRC